MRDARCSRSPARASRATRLPGRRLCDADCDLHENPDASERNTSIRLQYRFRRWRTPSSGTRQSSSWAAGELTTRANESGAPHEAKDAGTKLELGGLVHKKCMREPGAVDIDEVGEIQRADPDELGEREMLRACCEKEQ
jgi:hypothetical protein